MNSVIYDISTNKTTRVFGTVVINFIKDPFNPIESKSSKTDLHGEVLHKYLDGYCLGAEYLVSVNRNIMEKEDLDTYIVQPNDIITYTPMIQGGGGGGKNILMMVAMIVLTIVSYGAAAVAFGGTFAGGIASVAAGAATWGATALAVGMIVAGSLLINSILGPSGNLASSSNPEVESRTYSWNGATTSRDIGGAIPVLYGTHALSGTVINSRIYYQGDDDWIGTQLALCNGTIENISSDKIYINGLEYKSYIDSDSSDGYYTYTNGTFDQPIIKGYDDSIYNNSSVSRKLNKDDIYEFVTTSNNINYFRLHFECPNGLYAMDTQGNKSLTTTSLKVQYKEETSDTWYDLFMWNPSGTLEYEYEYKSRYYFSNRSYKVWSTNANLPTKEELIRTEDSWDTIVWTPYKTGATRYTTQEFVPDSTITFTDRSSNPYRTYIEPRDTFGNPMSLPRGQYRFRVTPLTETSEDPYLSNAVYVRYIEEIETSNMNYGGVALLAVDIKATDQLNNARPDFKVIATRAPLLLNGTYRPSDNPAWVCLDILTNKHYGMGIDIKNINIKSFEKWAKFCSGTESGTFTVSNNITSLSSDDLYNGSLLIPTTYVPTGESLTLSRLIKSESTITGTKKLKSLLSSTSLAVSIKDINSIEQKYLEASGNRPAGFYYVITLSPTSLGAYFKLGTSVSYDLVFTSISAESTPRLSFNGVMDTTTSVWESLQDVATIGRGQIVLMGTKYSVIYDAPKVVSGLYNASNSNNVTVTYINQADIASEIEIQFADKNILYEMNTITVQDIVAMDSQVRPNKVTKSFKGICSEEEALVMGRYLLASSKYLRRVITLEADIESLTQTVGDVIAVQTDVTQYGIGGLVVSKIGNMVTLDNTLYIEKGKTYTLKIKHYDTDIVRDYTFRPGVDTPVDYISIDALGDTLVGVFKFDDFNLVLNFDDENFITSNTIILSEAYTINVMDRYAFGESGSDSILCTITDISREGDLTRKISAVEYNESILDFNYDNDIVQRITASTRPKNTISNFRISDRLVKLSNSQVVAMLSMSWESVTTGYYNLYTLEGKFKNYLVMGIKGNRYEYAATDIPQGVLTRIHIEDASDNSLYTYNDYTITSFASPPPTLPTNGVTILGKGDQLEFKINYANKPLDFHKYSVNLNGSNFKGDFVSDVFYIPPELGTNTLQYKIKVFDTVGNSSSETVIPFTATPPNIVAVTYSLTGDFVTLNINSIKGTFDIDHYTIEYTEGQYNRIITTKEVDYKALASWVGNKEFKIKAFDVIGNSSLEYVLTASLAVPKVINLVGYIENKEAIIKWDAPNTQFAIDYYVITYIDYTGQTVSINSKTTSIRLPVFWGGNKTFDVKVVTTLGNYSLDSTTSILVALPQITNLQSEVIDNNVLLKWVGVETSLPIENYILYKGINENSLEVIGEKKGTFTTIFENVAGSYIYWMSAIDSAGNHSVKIKVSASVSEPPNYVLNLEHISTFNGVMNNAISNGLNLVLPVNDDDSIQEHFDNNGWDTAMEQINAGYTRWIEPFETSGSYIETVDYGAVLPSSMVSIIFGYDVIKGTPNVTPIIRLSLDNSTWITYEQAQVYGSNFRYIQMEILVTGTNSAINVHTLKLKIDSKEKTDSGRIQVSDVGTFIPFNKAFVDIESITVSPESSTPVFALYDFEDVPNPLGFTAYIFDISGTKVSGTVSWIAKGY